MDNTTDTKDMSDIKLLVLAAKSYGFDFGVGYDEYITGPYIIVDGFPIEWNPLDDDGDTFRLMCDLEIDIVTCQSLHQVTAYHKSMDNCVELNCVNGDMRVAIRRAITMVAAQIAIEQGY